MSIELDQPITSRPPSTLAEQAFSRLHADIVNAKLRPGEKMHVQRLSKAYGVGATPLREALSRLSSLALVTAEGQRGFRVAPVSVENLLDITKTRAWVEAIALRASIAAGDRHWEAQVVAAAHRLKHCPVRQGEPLSDEWYLENRRFHDALVAACNSRQTMIFHTQLYDLSDRYRRLSVRFGLAGRNLEAEHQAIMEAALARDAETAVARTIEHFVLTVRPILLGEIGRESEIDRIIDTLRRDIMAGIGVTPKT